MEGNKTISYVCAGLLVFMIIGLFTPLISYRGSSVSFWDAGLTIINWVWIITCVLGILFCLINKGSILSLIPGSFVFAITLFIYVDYSEIMSLVPNMSLFSIAGVGFYFSFIGSIGVIILEVINYFMGCNSVSSSNDSEYDYLLDTIKSQMPKQQFSDPYARYNTMQQPMQAQQMQPQQVVQVQPQVELQAQVQPQVQPQVLPTIQTPVSNPNNIQ